MKKAQTTKSAPKLKCYKLNVRVRAPNTGKKICLTKKIAVRAQRPCMRKIHMCWCGYKTAQTKSTNEKKK